MLKGSAGEQLKMFMSPREVSQDVESYGDFPFGNPKTGLPHKDMEHQSPSMAERKSERSGSNGMDDPETGIAAQGVQEPINLNHMRGGGKTLVNGHHRTQAQSKADPDRLMPVTHTGYGSFVGFRR